MNGRKKRRLALLVSALSVLSACSPGYPGPLLWHKFKPHSEDTLVTVAPGSHCPRVGPQNLPDEERRILLEAMAEVCRVVASPEFKQEVIRRRWLATCNGSPDRPDLIPGDEVYRLFMSAVGPFSVRFRKPVNAEASTQIARARIAIRRTRLRAWRVEPSEGRRHLVNTLAHEMTHMVPATDPNELFRFQDKGHAKKARPAVELVSYGIGDLVERLWLERAGLPVPAPKEKVESC
ncbi:MAG TPA: hypothetical protein VF605_07510 [Allosphingosinicella sp.]|jgi:hypothetical protein